MPFAFLLFTWIASSLLPQVTAQETLVLSDFTLWFNNASFPGAFDVLDTLLETANRMAPDLEIFFDGYFNNDHSSTTISWDQLVLKQPTQVRFSGSEIGLIFPDTEVSFLNTTAEPIMVELLPEEAEVFAVMARTVASPEYLEAVRGIEPYSNTDRVRLEAPSFVVKPPDFSIAHTVSQFNAFPSIFDLFDVLDAQRPYFNNVFNETFTEDTVDWSFTGLNNIVTVFGSEGTVVRVETYNPTFTFGGNTVNVPTEMELIDVLRDAVADPEYARVMQDYPPLNDTVFAFTESAKLVLVGPPSTEAPTSSAPTQAPTFTVSTTTPTTMPSTATPTTNMPTTIAPTVAPPTMTDVTTMPTAGMPTMTPSKSMPSSNNMTTASPTTTPTTSPTGTPALLGSPTTNDRDIDSGASSLSSWNRICLLVVTLTTTTVISSVF